MDMATIMSMFQGAGGAAPAAPGGASFGLGSPLVQGQMGQAQMAQPQTFMGNMQDALGQMGGQLTPEMMQQLGPMAMAMMQQQQGGQQQQGAPMPMGMAQMMGGGMQPGATQASRGYLAQGGGMARNLVNRGM